MCAGRSHSFVYSFLVPSILFDEAGFDITSPVIFEIRPSLTFISIRHATGKETKLGGHILVRATMTRRGFTGVTTLLLWVAGLEACHFSHLGYLSVC